MEIRRDSIFADRRFIIRRNILRQYGIRHLRALIPCVGTHEPANFFRVFLHVIRAVNIRVNHSVIIVDCLI